MVCVNCDSEKVIKSGFYNDMQRYKCKSCGYRFTDSSRKRPSDPYWKTKALQLWLEGLNIKIIAGLVGFNESTVKEWLNPYLSDLRGFRLNKYKQQTKIFKHHKMLIVDLDSKFSSGVVFRGQSNGMIWGVCNRWTKEELEVGREVRKKRIATRKDDHRR